MTATIYRDAGFGGPFARYPPGFYSGRELVGYQHQSTHGEELDNEISSLRVDPNTIAAIYNTPSLSAARGARVIVGPSDVPDLGALGMGPASGAGVSALLVLPFKGYDSAVPVAPGSGATLYADYNQGGKHSFLPRGDYDAGRLASEEVRFPANRARSIAVTANALAILYAGPSFDADRDATVVVGPTVVGDLERLGFADRVSSVRVLYSDPFDVPPSAGRPTPLTAMTAALGTTRLYTPQGWAGPLTPPAFTGDAGGPPIGGPQFAYDPRAELVFPGGLVPVGAAGLPPTKWGLDGAPALPPSLGLEAGAAASAVSGDNNARRPLRAGSGPHGPSGGRGAAWRAVAIVLFVLLVVLGALMGVQLRAAKKSGSGGSEAAIDTDISRHIVFT